MPGLPISQLLQDTNLNIATTDLLPIERTVASVPGTYSLPGRAFVTSLSSIGTGNSLVGSKGYSSTGNQLGIKSLSAALPIVLNDNGRTLTVGFSGEFTNFGITPLNCPISTPNGTKTSWSLPSVPLPTDPLNYRVDINGVLQKPGTDYSINYSTSPYNIQFTTPPSTGEGVTVIAFAPTTTSPLTGYAPILDPNSIFANISDYSLQGSSLNVPDNSVVCNPTGVTGLTALPVSTNQFVGNTGSGLAAVTLSAGGGLTLNTSVANTAAIDGSYLLTLIQTLSSNMNQIGNYPYLEFGWVCAPNTAGQTIAANAVTPLTIDTEVADLGGYGCIAGNLVTLAAGTYRFNAFTKLHLANTVYLQTDIVSLSSSTLGVITRSGGTSFECQANGSSQIYSLNTAIFGFDGQFTAPTSTKLTLTMFSSTGGSVSNSGSDTGSANATNGLDQRTTLKLWKVA